MQKLSLKDQIFVGITLFSMFFGAGNLIFPPLLGAQSGNNALYAFFGFALSAIGFPILGVAAVAKSGGLKKLAERVNKPFAAVFTLLIYLSIGPCLAIPRTAGTSFEMAVTPFVGNGQHMAMFQVLYSVVFFAIALMLALHPSSLVDYLGKKLAPILLVLIAVLFSGCFLAGISGTGNVNEVYASSPAVQGFIDGYQTMDAIAALIFGIVLAMNIKNRGVTENDIVVKTTIRAGLLAAVFFVAVYGALTFIGLKSTAFTAEAQNGAQILTAVAQNIFGQAGLFILAAIFVIACLNTCIGLICCCAEYFNEIVPKLSYKMWAVFFAVISAVVANAGLNAILRFSVPVLNCLYPVAIVLILLAFLPEAVIKRPMVYPLTVLFAGVVGFIYALNQINVILPFLTAAVSRLPFYDIGLGWIIPALIGFGMGALLKGNAKKLEKN